MDITGTTTSTIPSITQTPHNGKESRIGNRVPLTRPFPLLRYAVCGLILLGSILPFYYLSVVFISQLHVLLAEKYKSRGYYGLAIEHLKKACDYQPDDYKLWQKKGDVHYALSQEESLLLPQFAEAMKAKKAYMRASRENPLEVVIAYDLAKTEYRLEELHRHLYPGSEQHPFNALPYLERAIHLKPYSIQYRYAMARYLFFRHKTNELLGAIKFMGNLYPPALQFLKREPFWSPAVRRAFQEGLREAIEKGVLVREAALAMSTLFSEDQLWPEAIAYYEKALQYQEKGNRRGDYIHLGELYLKDGKLQEANSAFLLALEKDSSIPNSIKTIYRLFTKNGYLQAILPFHHECVRRFGCSNDEAIILARTLIDGKLYQQAQEILTELIKTAPSAEAYYNLGCIAGLEGDLNRAEVFYQKATVLEPADMHYRRSFIRLLKRRGKLETVERELGTAIHYSNKPSSSLFSERASLRWKLKNYLGALEDWKSAILLSKRKAPLYAQAGEACLKLGNLKDAVSYYQKATKLEPDNKRYTKRYQELKAGSS